MKRYIIVCLSILFFSSCSNWLDVQPKTTVEEEEVFSREIGFKEALTGIYIKMASKDLYAKNLSYGFLDILGQRYEPSNVEAYQDELWYTFPSTKTESYTTTIWGKMYNIIANVNNLLYYCDKKRDVLLRKIIMRLLRGGFRFTGISAFLICCGCMDLYTNRTLRPNELLTGRYLTGSLKRCRHQTWW